jgi:hypothetical protein
VTGSRLKLILSTALISRGVRLVGKLYRPAVIGIAVGAAEDATHIKGSTDFCGADRLQGCADLELKKSVPHGWPNIANPMNSADMRISP